jgi:phage terminase small subunit
MNTKQHAFVNAYLGEANGNGTKAAITAGYSERTATVIASQLLRHPAVQAELERRLKKADLRTDAILQRLAKIVHSEPEKVTGADIIGASKVILQVNGALSDRHPGAGITVNIGFLSGAHSQQITADLSHTHDIADAQVMPHQPQVALSPVRDVG